MAAEKFDIDNGFDGLRVALSGDNTSLRVLSEIGLQYL